jgi:pantetheine-phosphate adenylyltransferase
MNRALFPGSFDPFTLGHEDIVNRGLELFDEIIIGIGINTTKQNLFSIEERKKIIGTVFSHSKKVKVKMYETLTTEFAKEEKCKFILRGIRNQIDFEYEKSIAEMNKKLNSEIETVLLFCAAEFNSISSTIVREIYKSGGNIEQFVPKSSIKYFKK